MQRSQFITPTVTYSLNLQKDLPTLNIDKLIDFGSQAEIIQLIWQFRCMASLTTDPESKIAPDLYEALKGLSKLAAGREDIVTKEKA